jgi:hypothetical protein
MARQKFVIWLTVMIITVFSSCVFIPQTVLAGAPAVPTAASDRSRFCDPFVYCAAIGTTDAPDERYTGPPVPEAIVKELRKKVDIADNAPDYWVAAGTVWRCMDGRVWACFVGANLPCSERADSSSAPKPRMEAFCKTNPEADSIPAAVTGRATIYDWRCADGSPSIVTQRFTPDAGGFLSDFWHELSTP